MEKEINKTIEVLKKGGVILYPTDTIWGIGCDATNSNAISKIFKIKKRANSKSLISLVANKRQLENITGFVPNLDIISNPTTIIYPSILTLNRKLLARDGSAGIRIVQDNFCQEIIQRLGKPLVSTSANISGSVSPKQFSEISEEIKKNMDYIVDLRKTELMSAPSTILRINKDGTNTKIR